MKGLNPDELPSESCVKEAVTENRLRFRKPGHLFKSTVLDEERVKIAAAGVSILRYMGISILIKYSQF